MCVMSWRSVCYGMGVMSWRNVCYKLEECVL